MTRTRDPIITKATDGEAEKRDLPPDSEQILVLFSPFPTSDPLKVEFRSVDFPTESTLIGRLSKFRPAPYPDHQGKVMPSRTVRNIVHGRNFTPPIRLTPAASRKRSGMFSLPSPITSIIPR